jgi:hypothetical protein
MEKVLYIVERGMLQLQVYKNNKISWYVSLVMPTFCALSLWQYEEKLLHLGWGLRSDQEFSVFRIGWFQDPHHIKIELSERGAKR